MNARYSALKAMKFPDRLDTVRGRADAGPVHVQMILSDLCNQSCHFCAYRDPKYTSSQLFHVDGNYNPHRMLPTEKAKEILEDCARMGVRAIQFTGGGEPTVHPQFQQIADFAHNLGLPWALVTNGVVIKHDLSNAAWIRVSLDAGTPETYMRIRSCGKGHFERAMATINRYRCGVGFVITPENWQEVFTAAMLARDHGASNFRISAQFSTSNESLFGDDAPRIAALCRMAEGLSGGEFTVHNRFSEKIGDLTQQNPDYERCGYQFFTTYIGADQNLYRCCVYAYNPRGLIASLKGRRFPDVWRDALANFRKFDARGCERCQFNRINRNILEVTEADESEVFV